MRSSDPLCRIRCYLPISAMLATAGQPTEEQFSWVRDAGFQTVINLALPTSLFALPDERTAVESLGMEYVPIPVNFENPPVEDVRRFFDAMDTRPDRKIVVHCVVNKRVSVFVYLWRALRQSHDPDDAEVELHDIWVPNRRWQQLIETVRQQK